MRIRSNGKKGHNHVILITIDSHGTRDAGGLIRGAIAKRDGAL